MKRVSEMPAKDGLRERGKDRRRRRILAAARRILVQEGAEGLVMRRIAEEAEVSVVTLYNLYGGKDAIVGALLDESLQRMGGAEAVRFDPAKPLEALRSALTSLIRQYTRESAFYRPLFRAVDGLALTGETAKLLTRSSALTLAVVRAAMDQGDLTRVLSAETLAIQITLSFLQASRHWARGDLDDASFEALALLGAHFCLVTASTPRTRDALLRRARRYDRTLRRIAPLSDAWWRKIGARRQKV
jgi:AcrR family transcriptional regulator